MYGAYGAYGSWFHEKPDEAEVVTRFFRFLTKPATSDASIAIAKRVVNTVQETLGFAAIIPIRAVQRIGDRMFASSRMTCFWPGLAAAWYRGNTTSLAIAIFSTWALVLLLLATFVWPQWVSLIALRGLWLLAFVVWIGATSRSQWQFARMMQVSKPLEAKDNFLLAQTDYLAGNWFEAEAKLLQILHDFPRDAESQLLLVGVLRHTRRFRPALRRLAHLETLDSATRWRYELARERTIIESRIEEELAEQAEVTSEPDQILVGEVGETPSVTSAA